MAILENSINANQFQDLRGPIFYRQEQLEVLNRPGIDGSGVRALGARGEPFELVSLAYHADFAAAKTALQAYDDLPGTDPVALVRNGVAHGNYLVLMVREVETRAVYSVVADGVPSTHTVRQVVFWRLLG